MPALPLHKLRAFRYHEHNGIAEIFIHFHTTNESTTLSSSSARNEGYETTNTSLRAMLPRSAIQRVHDIVKLMNNEEDTSQTGHWQGRKQSSRASRLISSCIGTDVLYCFSMTIFMFFTIIIEMKGNNIYIQYHDVTCDIALYSL